LLSKIEAANVLIVSIIANQLFGKLTNFEVISVKIEIFIPIHFFMANYV
jgi:hypothetical protein